MLLRSLTKFVLFGDGWSRLKDVYELWFGAWVNLTYIDPKHLVMRLSIPCVVLLLGFYWIVI
jgi:hypothetical protein